MVRLKISSWRHPVATSHSIASNNIEIKKQEAATAPHSTCTSPTRATITTAVTTTAITTATAIPMAKARNIEATTLHKSGRQSDDSLSNGARTATAMAAASQSTKMSALAQTISRETEKVEVYFRESGLPTPSFDIDSPGDYPKLPDEIAKSRREVIRATQELRDLMIGPRESVRWLAWDFIGTQSLQILYHYGIAKLVPTHGAISLTELQSKTTLDGINLARVLRYAMTKHIFHSPSLGFIAHTAASRLLAKDEDLSAWVGFNTEDIYPASAHVRDAFAAHPEATSLTRTGFNFAFDTVDQEPMFVTFGKDPKRAKRMARAMSSLTGGEGYETSFLVNVNIFEDIDSRSGVFVDMGGSHGFVCVDLAKRYRNMRFVVQDLPKTVSSAPDPISDDEQISDRIIFEAHDFFTEQTHVGADVYFFRWIIHNYSSPYAIKILRSLIPALKPGARIVINDHCLREQGKENPWDERIMCSMDLVMMTLLNAQERTEAEFRQLFELADPGFVFKGVTRPKGCRMSIVEAVWKPYEVGEETLTLRGEKTP